MTELKEPQVKKSLAALVSVAFIFSALVPPSASAAEVNLYGVVVKWKDKLYQPDGCSEYAFDWTNGSNQKLLSLEVSVTDPYDRKVADEDKIGVDQGVSGTFKMQICKHNLQAGLGPYTVKVYIESYSGGFGSRAATQDITFLAIPGAVPSPAPASNSLPSPTPTVTVTATPSTFEFFRSEAVRLATEYASLRKQFDSLNSKLKKVCSNKPKPKGC